MVILTNTKAGNLQMTIKAGAGKWMKIHRWYWILTNDATVANRYMIVSRYAKTPAGAYTMLPIMGSPAITASQTHYTAYGPEIYARTMALGPWGGTANSFCGGPPLYLMDDDYIEFGVTNGVAGDAQTLVLEVTMGDKF